MSMVRTSAFESSVASHASIGRHGWMGYSALVLSAIFAFAHSVMSGDIFFWAVGIGIWMLGWPMEKTRQQSVIWMTKDYRDQNSWNFFGLDTEEMKFLREGTLLAVGLLAICVLLYFGITGDGSE